MKSMNHYELFAACFQYPNANEKMPWDSITDIVLDSYPEQLGKLGNIVDSFSEMNLFDQQEYYLKTFDVQAVCFLDIGYLLFGEDYKRAQLLVNLQTEHQKNGIDCGSELADHLPNVLKLLAHSRDQEFAQELGFVLLIPTVRFMISKFKNTENFYKDLLEILLIFLQHDFDIAALAEYAIPEKYFKGEHEFLMPSPKTAVCESMCNKRKKL